MNIQQSKTIDIKDILAKMNIFHSYLKGDDLWFKSPFSINERTPSFKVKGNIWYCQSSGFGGYALDLIIKLNNCSVSDALQFLKYNSFSFQTQNFEPRKEQEKSYYIEKIIPIQHSALIQYLVGRGLTNFHKENDLKEIHYIINDKKYFAIGFKNRSDGWEISSKHSKLCLLKKDISLIENNSINLKVFEGFIDYICYLQNNNSKIIFDYLILNSVALLEKNILILKKYTSIELFLDNDIAGDKCTKLILENFPYAIDRRLIYKEFKDYNDWFLNNKLEKIDTPKQDVTHKRRR